MQFELYGVGTQWTFKISDSSLSLKDEIINLIFDFDLKYSRFRPDSLLYGLKNRTGVFKVGREFVDLLKIYKYFESLTNNKFTPFSSIVLEKIGYDPDLSFNEKFINLEIPTFEEAVEIIDDESIKILKKISFDFGAIGKGFLIDKIYNFLSDKGLDYFVINGGGDIRHFNSNNNCLEIFLEHPIENNKYIGKCSLSSTFAICASSIFKRRWKDKNHIIDVFNKDSVGNDNKVVASFVIAKNASLADALATISILPDVDKCKFPLEFESLIIYKNLSCVYTDAFDCILF